MYDHNLAFSKQGHSEPISKPVQNLKMCGGPLSQFRPRLYPPGMSFHLLLPPTEALIPKKTLLCKPLSHLYLVVSCPYLNSAQPDSEMMENYRVGSLISTTGRSDIIRSCYHFCTFESPSRRTVSLSDSGKKKRKNNITT